MKFKLGVCLFADKYMPLWTP